MELITWLCLAGSLVLGVINFRANMKQTAKEKQAKEEADQAEKIENWLTGDPDQR